MPNKMSVERAVGGQGEGLAKQESLRQQAAAWDEVVTVLNEVTPGWILRRSTGVECAIFAIRGLATLRTELADMREELDATIEQRDLLSQEVLRLEKDAGRWRHARKLLTFDDIEGAQGAFDSFGGMVSEEECARADAAIDAAMKEQQP